MCDYIRFTNPENGEVITIEITNNKNLAELFEQLNKLPKDETGKRKFGNILIHQFGGGSMAK